jgi:hypothetical protein
LVSISVPATAISFVHSRLRRLLPLQLQHNAEDAGAGSSPSDEEDDDRS